jgi:hypothetical protein
LERLATTAAGFFDVFDVFETLDPDRPAVVDAASLALDLVLDVELAGAVLVADALCDVDVPDAPGCDADRLATAVLGAVLAGFDATCACVDLWCTAVFETDCFDAGAFAVVFDGAFCPARFPAARRASVIARFETCKRSV